MRYAALFLLAVLACSDSVAPGPEPEPIRIEPQAVVIEVGQTATFVTVNGDAPIVVRDESIAGTVAPLRIVGRKPGSTYVIADQDSAFVQVVEARPCLLTYWLEPADIAVRPGAEVRYRIVGCGVSTADFDFTSSSTAASIDGNGRALALSEGQAVITARRRTDSTNLATAILRVDRESPVHDSPASVTITPASAAVQVNKTQAFAAAVRNAAGLTLDVMPVWSSSNQNVATVDASGAVFARSPGSTMIRASAGGVFAEALVTVIPPKGVPLWITPAHAAVNIGESIQFSSSMSVSWVVADSAVASVTTAGLVTGRKSGLTYVSAVSPLDSTQRAVALLTVR